MWAATHRVSLGYHPGCCSRIWESDWNQFLNRYDQHGLGGGPRSQLRWAMGMAVDFDRPLGTGGRWVSRWLEDGTYIGSLLLSQPRTYRCECRSPRLCLGDRYAGNCPADQSARRLLWPIGETPHWTFRHPELAGISGPSVNSARCSAVEAFEGFWQAVFDGHPNAVWGPVVWDADLASGHTLRSFSSNGASGWSGWEEDESVYTVARTLHSCGDTCRRIPDESPVLHDLTVGTLGYAAPAASTMSVSAGADIDALAGYYELCARPRPLRGSLRRSTSGPRPRAGQRGIPILRTAPLPASSRPVITRPAHRSGGR